MSGSRVVDSLGDTVRVLVTGANGFVGRQTCAALVDLKMWVRRAVRNLSSEALFRSESQADCSHEICDIGEIGESTDWSKALEGVNVVVHLAAHVHAMDKSSAGAASKFRNVNAIGTERLARAAARAGVRRIVYLSSAGVHGRCTIGEPFTEADTPRPYDAYTNSKWVAEQKLRQIAMSTGLETTIIRAPLVFGPQEPGNFMRLLRLIDRGIPLPFASLEARRSYIYVCNLASAIVICVRDPRAAGQTYLVSDGEDVSTLELIKLIGQALGRPVTLVPCPRNFLRVLGLLSGRSQQLNTLLAALVVDSSKIRRELSWTPPYSMLEGLQKTADWYLSNKHSRTADRPLLVHK